MNNAQQLITFVKNIRGTCQRDVALDFVLLAASILLAIGTLLQVFFALFPWTMLPVIFDALMIGWIGAVIWRLLGIALHPPSLVWTAQRLQRQSAAAHPLLSVAVELSLRNDTPSASLSEEVYRRAAEQLPALPRRISGLYNRYRCAAFIAALLAAPLASLMTQPRLISFWDLPLTYFARTSGTVYPGTVSVAQNSSVTLGLVPRDRHYPSCRLSLQPQGSAGSSLLLKPGADGTFSYRCDSLTRTTVYRFALGAAAFDAESIRVIDRPTLYKLQISVTPPGYTGIRTRQLAGGVGSFSAYAGSPRQIT